MKLSEVSAGDVIVADGGFTCMAPGERVVLKNFRDDGSLYVECEEGHHYLDGQVGDDGDVLIGFTKRGE